MSVDKSIDFYRGDTEEHKALVLDSRVIELSHGKKVEIHSTAIDVPLNFELTKSFILGISCSNMKVKTFTGTNIEDLVPPGQKIFPEIQCVICLEGDAETVKKSFPVLVPCGHQCVCKGCCKTLKSGSVFKCPICREVFRMIVFPDEEESAEEEEDSTTTKKKKKRKRQSTK